MISWRLEARSGRRGEVKASLLGLHEELRSVTTKLERAVKEQDSLREGNAEMGEMCAPDSPLCVWSAFTAF